jgi:cyanophycinase-like exopeptidase
MTGPIALVGSGEWLPVMTEVEAGLLEGRPQKYVQLSTAAGQEGDESLRRWRQLGAAQAERIGVPVDWLPVIDVESANDPALAARVAGAGLIYLSGGDPGYLAEALLGSVVWDAIVAEWKNGAALAGCSAGAMVMGKTVPRFRGWRPGKAASTEALGLLPHLRVWPHFDRMGGRLPDAFSGLMARKSEGLTVVGIDEDTAIVGGPTEWVVQGRRKAWIIGDDGHKTPFSAGETLTTLQ